MEGPDFSQKYFTLSQMKEAVSKGRQTDLLGTASVSFSDHLVIYSFFEAGISPYF